MTVTPTKRLIILILGITTNLSLGNMPSATAKNAANTNNLILLHHYVEFDNLLSYKYSCFKSTENDIFNNLNSVIKNESS